MISDPAAAATAESSISHVPPAALPPRTAPPPRAAVAPAPPVPSRPSAAPASPPPSPRITPPPTLPAPPPARVNAAPGAGRITSPAEAWSALLVSIADKPQAGWIKSFTLRSLDNDLARLVVNPGARDMLKFVTAERREGLAKMLGAVIGRPLRVEIEAPSAADSAADTTPQGNADRGPRVQDAVAIPLVREVMDLFDATIVEVRRAGEPSPNTTPQPASPVDGPGFSESDAAPSLDMEFEPDPE